METTAPPAMFTQPMIRSSRFGVAAVPKNSPGSPMMMPAALKLSVLTLTPALAAVVTWILNPEYGSTPAPSSQARAPLSPTGVPSSMFGPTPVARAGSASRASSSDSGYRNNPEHGSEDVFHGALEPWRSLVVEHRRPN